MSEEITLPKSIKVTEKNQQKHKATLEIEGCYPRYGVTLANSLRRVLLSSLKGAAVTNFTIKGIEHEFTTIPGVKEDVIQISLNLKELNFKLSSDKKQTLHLKVEGEQEVTADQIQTPQDVEIITTDHKIFTLTETDAAVEMDITLETGYGFETSEERKDEKLPISTISVDANYSPVKKVSYDIEEMRIGERTDFNRVIMTIKTDGSVTPIQAFQKAASILEEQFGFLAETEPNIEEGSTEEETEEKASSEKEASEISVDSLDIPTRVINILEDNRIKSAAGLAQRKKETLEEMKGLGSKSVEQIEQALSEHDISLK